MAWRATWQCAGALEEIGQPYAVRTVALSKLKEADHLARQPFGQIPAYEDEETALFESGAIVLHLGQADARLLPAEAPARARAMTWMFAATSTIEPAIVHLETAQRAYAAQAWRDAALQPLEYVLHRRLAALEAYLHGREWLEDRFTAGDLLMIQALRRLEGNQILAAYPRIAAYLARGMARPGFARAFAAQRETWLATAAPIS